MEKINKFLGFFALSLALVVSGCGKKLSAFKSSHSMKHGDNSKDVFEGQEFSKDRIYFALDKFDTISDHQDTINFMVDYLKQQSSAKIVIEGFCDNNGTFAHNIILSRKRAASLKEKLVAHGIEESRIINLVGYGFKFEVPEGQSEIDASNTQWSDKCGKICASNRAARAVLVK
jgi:outer membrane protein OmpA-like peptidoglycan-associated protein